MYQDTLKSIEQVEALGARELAEIEREHNAARQRILAKCAPHQRATIEALWDADLYRTRSKYARADAAKASKRAVQATDTNSIRKAVTESNRLHDAAGKLEDAANGFAAFADAKLNP